MELRHLRYFIVVAEEQNITRAAARLHISQPPLSRQIRALEDELGVVLFEHTAKSVQLSEAGRIFLEEARAVLQRANEAVQVARAVACGQRGTIHVGHAPALVSKMLPITLQLFHEANPQIRVQLYDLSTVEMLRGLRDGKIDVALLVNVQPRIMNEFAFQEIRRDPVCVAVHSAHSLAQERKIGIERVAKEPIIAFTMADYPEYHAWLNGLFEPLNCKPRIVEEHDSVAGLIASVGAARGVALVLESFKHVVSRGVKIRNFVPPLPPVVIGAAQARKAKSANVESFIAAAKRASTTSPASLSSRANSAGLH
jgi:DNA-binding transcriptional LysR family regulator